MSEDLAGPELEQAENDGLLPAWFMAIRRSVDAVTTGLNVFGTVLILLVMVLVNTDVAGRNFFNAPVSGVPEIVSMSIVAIVFLQVAQTFRKGRLTRADAVPRFLARRTPRLRFTLEIGFGLAAGFVVLQVFLASVPLFEKAWLRNTFQGTVGDFTAPIWPVKLIILIGCVALMAQIALHTLGVVLRMFRRTEVST